MGPLTYFLSLINPILGPFQLDLNDRPNLGKSSKNLPKSPKNFPETGPGFPKNWEARILSGSFRSGVELIWFEAAEYNLPLFRVINFKTLIYFYQKIGVKDFISLASFQHLDISVVYKKYIDGFVLICNFHLDRISTNIILIWKIRIIKIRIIVFWNKLKSTSINHWKIIV